jgi:hypothetical protein
MASSSEDREQAMVAVQSIFDKYVTKHTFYKQE